MILDGSPQDYSILPGMKRVALLLSAAAWLCGQPRFTVVEATIPEMQAALKQKHVTSRELVTQYLVRIATYEHILHAAVTVNPNALRDADELDRERAAGKSAALCTASRSL